MAELVSNPIALLLAFHAGLSVGMFLGLLMASFFGRNDNDDDDDANDWWRDV